MTENILMALEIMWKGMVGIFAATILIMLVVWILSKFSSKEKLLKFRGALCAPLFLFSAILFSIAL